MVGEEVFAGHTFQANTVIVPEGIRIVGEGAFANLPISTCSIDGDFICFSALPITLSTFSRERSTRGFNAKKQTKQLTVTIQGKGVRFVRVRAKGKGSKGKWSKCVKVM